MNRGSTIVKKMKLLIIISFMLFMNISLANEKNNNEVATNKTQTQSDTLQSESKKARITDVAKVDTPKTLKSHTDIGASNYVQMLFGLFAIVVFIFAVAWLIKRMGTLNPNHSSNLKIIAGLSVGQREKIVVIQVMDEQLLVGITQSNIQLLSKLEQPIPEQSMHSLGGFQDKLQSAMNNFKKKTDAGENV